MSTDEEKDAWVLDTFGVDPRTYPSKAKATSMGGAPPSAGNAPALAGTAAETDRQGQGQQTEDDEIIAVLVSNKAQDKAGAREGGSDTDEQASAGSQPPDGSVGEIGKPRSPAHAVPPKGSTPASGSVLDKAGSAVDTAGKAVDVADKAVDVADKIVSLGERTTKVLRDNTSVATPQNSQRAVVPAGVALKDVTDGELGGPVTYRYERKILGLTKVFVQMSVKWDSNCTYKGKGHYIKNVRVEVEKADVYFPHHVDVTVEFDDPAAGDSPMLPVSIRVHDKGAINDSIRTFSGVIKGTGGYVERGISDS